MEDKIKILLIDDYESVTELLKAFIDKIINEYDNTLEVEYNIFHSVPTFIKSNHRAFDLAVIDWNIGHNSYEKGSNVIEKIGNETKNICIYTGMTDFEDVKEITTYASKHNARCIFKTSTDTKAILTYLRSTIGRINDKKNKSRSKKASS